MSAIPLITEGPNRTVVQAQQDFNVEGNAVLIAGLDLTQLSDEKTSNVSYDFRIGNKYRSHREQDPTEIPERGIITLHPGSAFIIQTEEYVHLPRHMFGIIAPKVSLLQHGLSSTFSKVDPGYQGHLLITLFNLGQTSRTLQKGQCFCAFSVLEVSVGARLYDKGAKQLQARLGKQPRRKFREWLEVHHIMVMVVLIVATLLLAIEHLITFILSIRQHP